MSCMSQPLVMDKLLTELVHIGHLRRPNEAVGLIMPDETVLELPNRAPNGQDRFFFKPSDIAIALENNRIDPRELDWSSVTLWHTHPAGGVGPSRIDMQCKIPQVHHLVIALFPEGHAEPTFY